VNSSLVTLSATSLPSFVSVARYTSPMPPAPSGDWISYAPSLEPEVSPTRPRYTPDMACSFSSFSDDIIRKPDRILVKADGNFTPGSDQHCCDPS